MSHPLQSSSIDKWIDAPTRRLDAAGTTFVYRRLGPATGVPVILLNHWGAVLDNFDPRIVDGLAATRPVIAVNYRGVGASGGKAPLTVAEMAEDAIAVIRALGFDEVDLIGFSLGGFVAQDIVRKEPDLIRKVILAGTGPAGGKGIERVGPVSWPLVIKGMLTFRDPKYYLFFTSAANSRRAAKDFLERLKERKADRDKPITVGGFLRQLKAIKAWANRRHRISARSRSLFWWRTVIRTCRVLNTECRKVADCCPQVKGFTSRCEPRKHVRVLAGRLGWIGLRGNARGQHCQEQFEHSWPTEACDRRGRQPC